MYIYVDEPKIKNICQHSRATACTAAKPTLCYAHIRTKHDKKKLIAFCIRTFILLSGGNCSHFDLCI